MHVIRNSHIFPPPKNVHLINYVKALQHKIWLNILL